MAIYNKKLDIIEKNKQKICSFNSEFPYLQYVKESFPITRFEVRFSARILRESEASVDYCFQFGKQLFIDYTRRFYNICMDMFDDSFERQPKSAFPKREDKFVSHII